MRDASLLPVSGPASTDTLAASGGLDVPGREPHPELANARDESIERHEPEPVLHNEPIPGERDSTTLTHREPGAIGGRPSGDDLISPDRHAWLDEQTAFEHAKEGGGGTVKRSRR